MTSQNQTPAETPLPEGENQPLGERVTNRSQPPRSASFKEFIGSQWAPRSGQLPARAEVAEAAARRRAAISQKFPGERLDRKSVV